MNSNVEAVKCGGCGLTFSEPANTPLDHRVPCPRCGSTARRIARDCSDGLATSGHLSALHERGGETIGFSETERHGRATSANLGNEGLLTIRIAGSSPQGEEDTHLACSILKERLNADGARWNQIVAGREPADCVFIDAEDPNATLDVQVVRAIASQNLWRQLTSSGSIQQSVALGEAADEIRLAIEGKARKIPSSLRGTLLLALDATRLAGIAFDAVVREFRSAHLNSLRAHGFAAVWLVGPVSRLCWRLD